MTELHRNYVGGEWVAGATASPNRNPSNVADVIGEYAQADAAQARLEYINRSVIGMMGVAPRDIDFRIKMPDEAGRRLLWEDKVVPSEEEAAVPSDEATDTLPGRAQSSSDPSKKKAI